MKSKVFGFISLAAAAAGAAFAGYKLVTDEQLRGRLLMSVKDAYDTSKKKVDLMTEDVALQTARMTKNPKVNQDYVEKQWENLGY